MKKADKTHYERVLSAAPIPFKKLIEGSPEIKELLFTEYEKAEVIPDFFLYLREYYTEEQIRESITGGSKGPVYESRSHGMAEFVKPSPDEVRMNELHKEFIRQESKGELPDQYYRPDIMNTNTVKSLKTVHNEIEILEKSLFWDSLDIHKEAETRGASVLLALRKMNNPTLAAAVIDSIVSENENKALTIKLIMAKPMLSGGNKLHTAKETWRALKSNFNLILENGKTEIQPKEAEIKTPKYTAKQFVLSYLFECDAKGESYPVGSKILLENIGNERIGAGKGNRFYKAFNEVIQKDRNTEIALIEIGGENWREIVLRLSPHPGLIEKYLSKKQL